MKGKYVSNTQNVSQVSSGVASLTLQPAVEEQALVEFAPETIGQGLTFFKRFADDPDAAAALKQEAARVLPILATKPTELISYGMDALDDVVKTTREVFKLTKDVKLPEDEDAALRDLKLQLGKAGGYDMSVAENVAKYREMKAKIGKMFGGGKAKAYFEAFQADRQSLEQLTDEMSGDLMTRAMDRNRMAATTAQLYRDNQESLLLLAERVAVLEKVRDMAQTQRNSLPATIAPDDPNAEKANALDMFIRMLDLKVTEYAGRWYTGVALAPVLRAQYEQQIMMALKLQTSATIGMEKVRIILAQYALSLSMQQDVDTVTTFDNFSNEMSQKMFKQTRQTVGAVAAASTSSSMTKETISVMAQEVAGMIGDVQQAYATAKADQAEKLMAMQDAVEVIESAQTSNGSIDLHKVSNVVAVGRKTRSITGG
jgi:hypothetical protein